jgi:2-amino-4-hydroxy-6-hydroxymethyldihydropteridine diphosphokinase
MTSRPAPLPGNRRAERTAYVGLGSNLGHTEANLTQARELLGALEGVRLEAVSGLYLTEPQSRRDQPWFLNQVVALGCDPGLTAHALLGCLLDIERRMGREREVRFGPRLIDLDLLLFGDEILQTGDLILPHPRMRERAFVLVPLREIRPDLVFPDGQGIDAALAEITFVSEGQRIFQGKSSSRTLHI